MLRYAQDSTLESRSTLNLEYHPLPCENDVLLPSTYLYQAFEIWL